LSVRVDGDGANAVLRLSSILTNWNAGNGPRLLFHGGTDDRPFGEIGSFLQNTGTGANAYMTFSTRDSEAVAERVRITSAGSVGIGTVTPANADGWEKVLDVYGASHSKIIATANGPIETGIYSHTAGFYGSLAGGLVGTRNNHPLSFFTNAATRAVILADGNVGISTNAPAGRFHVSATVTDAGIFGTAVGNAFVIWPDGNAGFGPALMYPSALSLRIGTITGFGAAGWTERMRVNSSGNVGIGTNNPDCTLHTVSTLAGAGAATRIAADHIQNTGAGNWTNGLLVETANNTTNAYLIHGWAGGALKFAVYANGGMVATGLSAAAGPDTVRYNNLTGLFSYVVSSRRYKDKIQPLQDDFSIILKVEPKSFVYKADGRPDIGYIAEDLDEIGLKKLINYDKEGQPNSIQYDKIPLYILEVVKAQQKEIDSLKQELAQIKAKLK
jgi:hypothetical protein